MTAPSDKPTVHVRRDDTDSRYVALVDDRELGSAYFEQDAHGRLVFTHTEVSPEAEGQGVGSKLVRGALDDVRQSGQHIVARCPFVARFIDQHHEYQDLL